MVAEKLADLGVAAPFAVAFSGGLDSTALLASVPQARAIHVHHGLHACADSWAKHAQSIAQRLGRTCAVLRVEVERDSGLGLEAAARAARYAALSVELREGETLLTAHHAQDQAETLLLRLLRGAGLNGLRGITPKRSLGIKRWLARPLLEINRQELSRLVACMNLPVIDDPSNTDLRFERNFLRAEILPRLHERWPQLEQSFAHSIAALNGTQALLEARVLRPLSYEIGGWRELDIKARASLLSSWLGALGVASPSAARLCEFARQLDSSPSAAPSLALSGYTLKRYREMLYAVPDLPPLAPYALSFDGRELELPQQLGVLKLQPDAHSPRSTLTVRSMVGGERLRLKRAGISQDLKTLLQARGIPPWQRTRLPLIWDGAELLAIPGVLQADVFDEWLGGAELLHAHRMAPSF